MAATDVLSRDVNASTQVWTYSYNTLSSVDSPTRAAMGNEGLKTEITAG